MGDPSLPEGEAGKKQQMSCGTLCHQPLEIQGGTRNTTDSTVDLDRTATACFCSSQSRQQSRVPTHNRVAFPPQLVIVSR